MLTLRHKKTKKKLFPLTYSKNISRSFRISKRTTRRPTQQNVWNTNICEYYASCYGFLVNNQLSQTVNQPLQTDLRWFAGFSVRGCTLRTDQGQSRFPVEPVGGAVVCELFLPVSLEDRISRSKSGLRI